MLKSVREEADLGSPPGRFYTNASESVNSILKNTVGYKRSELPQLELKLRELCEEQEHEVERAVVRRGKYRFRPQYRHLDVAEAKWFLMSTDQRLAHLKKVNSISVCEVADPEDVRFCSDIAGPSTSKQAGISMSDLVEGLKPVESSLALPIVAIEGVARKAAEILDMSNGIVPAPGCSELSRMVMSKSGKRPHLVSPNKNGSMACNSDCPHFKSAGICSHVVAAAVNTNRLSQFVAALSKLKRSSNLHLLAVSDTPKGRGRKGGKAPAKRKCPTQIETRVPMNVDVSTVQNTASHCLVNAPIINSYNHPCAPPSYPQSPTPYVSTAPNPFKVHFFVENISVCHSCRGHYYKELGCPYDLCIQHQEWRSFTVPGNSSTQSRFGNVYYHCNLS